MRAWAGFLGDERGAISIDWVALTAGLLLLGVMVSYSIYNNGVSGLVASINTTMAAVGLADPGSAPSLNGGGAGGSSGLVTWPAGAPIPLGSVVTSSTIGAPGTLVLQDSSGNSYIAIDRGLAGRNVDGAVLSGKNQLTLTDGSTVAVTNNL